MIARRSTIIRAPAGSTRTTPGNTATGTPITQSSRQVDIGKLPVDPLVLRAHMNMTGHQPEPQRYCRFRGALDYIARDHCPIAFLRSANNARAANVASSSPCT